MYIKVIKYQLLIDQQKKKKLTGIYNAVTKLRFKRIHSGKCI